MLALKGWPSLSSRPARNRHESTVDPFSMNKDNWHMKLRLSNSKPNDRYILRVMETVVTCCILLGFGLTYYRGVSVTNVVLVIIAVLIAFFLGILALLIAQMTAILGGKDGLDLRRLLNKVEDIRRMIAERNELDGIGDRIEARRNADYEDAAKAGYLDWYLNNLKALEEARETSEVE
jgi:hypothetical protein